MTTGQTTDPYTVPAFSLRNRVARAIWAVVYMTLFRPSPRTMHAWRVWLLRCFGAKLGVGCKIYPSAHIWAPWNLFCEDVVAIADDVTIYNPQQVFLGSHSIVSQQAYLCGATHDYTNPAFPLIALPITVGRYAWVCARAVVQAGVTINEGAVLALAGVATKNLAPWSVYAGIPARKIKERRR